MKLCAAIFGMLLGGISTHAYALSPNRSDCHFYFSGDQPSDSEAASLLKFVKAGSPVRVCSGLGGGRAYFSASKIFHEDETHYFYLERVFLERNVKGKLEWTYLPSQPLLFKPYRYVYMAAEDFGELRQDSPVFVETDGVSLGVFEMIHRSWNAWINSTESFLAASSGLSMGKKILGGYRSFKAALKDDSSQPLSLFRIDFMDWMATSPPRYQLSVRNEEQYWHIEVDIGADHLRILKISEMGK